MELASKHDIFQKDSLMVSLKISLGGILEKSWSNSRTPPKIVACIPHAITAKICTKHAAVIPLDIFTKFAKKNPKISTRIPPFFLRIFLVVEAGSPFDNSSGNLTRVALKVLLEFQELLVEFTRFCWNFLDNFCF